MNNQLKTSVIVSTYNWPEALRLTIHSLWHQSVLPNEIVIADDGSKEATKNLIDELRAKSKIPIIHAWQEDKGWRQAKSRNVALAKCNNDYIIQIDGDIICGKDFIKDHLSYAKKGVVLCGRRVDLSARDTAASFSSQQLIFRDINNNKLSRRLRSPLLMSLLHLLNLSSSKFNKGVLGCNMSYFLDDALSIGGYNEEMEGWSKEDDEFLMRLEKKGVQKTTLRFFAIQYHLMHRRQPDLKKDMKF